MSLVRAARIVFAKELRTEFRARELLTTTIVFVLLVLALFSFTFEPAAAESRRFGPGLLWLAFLFAGSLMLQPSFLREQANDTLAALSLAPIEPFAILLGKIASNLFFMLLAELFLLPIFAVLYNVPVLAEFGPLALVFVLGTLGVATVGTVLSAISTHARMRELMLPLLLLPALTPVLIASTEVTAGLLSESPALNWEGVAFLVVFDIVFLTAAWLFGEYLFEE
jgi:heme exporter protein B